MDRKQINKEMLIHSDAMKRAADDKTTRDAASALAKSGVRQTEHAEDIKQRFDEIYGKHRKTHELESKEKIVERSGRDIER